MKRILIAHALSFAVLNTLPAVASAEPFSTSSHAVSASSEFYAPEHKQTKVVRLSNGLSNTPAETRGATASGPTLVVAAAPATVLGDSEIKLGSVRNTRPVPVWSVKREDKSIRETLNRWTAQAGWTFDPEHWAVGVDIPVSATATFSGDFKSAVRSLVGATELGEMPLQPCFYSNRVLRIIHLNEVCDGAQ